MYPRDYFNTYWRPQIRNEVFVAMQFSDNFNKIYENCYRPAIEENRLTPKRVDASILSGSIITDILDGIAHSKVVLADISIATDGKYIGQRNGNVMYEVGLAHAVRQNTEILIFKSDDMEINFDISHINIHRYDCGNLDETKNKLSKYIAENIKAIEQDKSLLVQNAIRQLDVECVELIHKGMTGPVFFKNIDDPLAKVGLLPTVLAYNRLQQLGIIASNRPPETVPVFGGQVGYYLTAFGNFVAKALELTPKKVIGYPIPDPHAKPGTVGFYFGVKEVEEVNDKGNK